MITDSPRLDAQAGMELATNCLWAGLSHTELVHNTGMIGSGKLVCTEAFVFADEIIGAVKAALAPADLSPSAFAGARDQVAAMDPGAEYVTHAHTLEHFRDFWYPSVLARANFDPLGDVLGPQLQERLSARAGRLQAEHQPEALPPEVARGVQELEAAWRRRAAD
jgi:trimethylamine--corrinoid protein Co-methyltransferase